MSGSVIWRLINRLQQGQSMWPQWHCNTVSHYVWISAAVLHWLFNTACLYNGTSAAVLHWLCNTTCHYNGTSAAVLHWLFNTACQYNGTSTTVTLWHSIMSTSAAVLQSCYVTCRVESAGQFNILSWNELRLFSVWKYLRKSCKYQQSSHGQCPACNTNFLPSLKGLDIPQISGGDV